jgi:hypothetical protein
METALQEILAGGIANSFRQAVLVALDPRRLDGASREENPGYQLLGFGPPVEIARVLFPRSCINRRSQSVNYATGIFVQNQDLRVTVTEENMPLNPAYVNWHFDAALQFQRVVLWDSFKARHHELERAGAIRHHLTDDRSEFGELRWLTRP